jgi:hypothetical protein
MDFSGPSGASDRGYGDSSRRSWGDPGRMMSELLTTHLAKSGRFDVVERARLYQLLNEKQISAGAGILGEQAKAIGSELGVAAIVVGSYSLGSYGYEVAARIVSTADGSIMATENALIPADPNWMDQSIAVLAGKLSAPWSKERGYVLDVFLETDRLPLVMVDLGTAQGARVGRKLEISTAGDPIIHPVTHENLGTRDVLLATAAIIQTQKEFSYARVMDRAGVTSGPVKADEGGIDLGIERMQRVKLLDEATDVADGDLSILSVTKTVEIRSDLPDAKLLVDRQPVALSNNSASVRLGAGTHLVELQVGQLLLSREITVTKQAVRPQQVAFLKADLGSAVAVKPPDAAAILAPTPTPGTLLARTAPEMSPAEQKTDEKLLAMLPSPQELDEQLKAAKDEATTAAFEAGLRALRYGYARGNRSYLNIAAARFADVVRLSPDLPLGYFNLGLAKFHLDSLTDAKAAFDQAVKLDRSLAPDVPLLWWEDFTTAPRQQDLMVLGQTPEWNVSNDGVLWYKGQAKDGLVLKCWDDAQKWSAQDIALEMRFRMLSAGSSILVASRFSGNRWVGMGLGLDLGNRVFIGTDGPAKSVAGKPFRISPGWHIVRFEAVDNVGRIYLDGDLILEGRDLPLWEGLADVNIGNCQPGEVLVDWLMVTRY